MNLFNRHEKCIGLTLWSFGRKHIQIWYCPRGYTIEKHSHPDEDIELMYLFGSTVFWRGSSNEVLTYFEESYKPKWHHFGRRFSVKAGMVHWFVVSKLPLIFINFSTFKQKNARRSAALDFKKTELGLWVK